MNNLQKIKQAAQIADKIITQVISELRVGNKESAIMRKIRRLAKRCGTLKCSFRPIVISGKLSAKPHGPTSHQKIKAGKLILIDLGVVYKSRHRRDKGFCSDISRTVVIGKPTPKQQKIYNIVKKAQAKALKRVKAGVSGHSIDQAARDYIEKLGYGKYFTHSTGHGIGRKIHQLPRISKNCHAIIKAGHVITIEPGIYIKGWGGVRIEDMVLVKKNGYDILTKTEKKLEIRK